MYSHFRNLRLTSLLCLILFISCNKTKTTNFKSVEVVNIYEDTLNVHALHPIDLERVWFATNRGKIGLLDGEIPKLAIIKYEDKLLHFRAITATDEAAFVMSIASPGIIYKIGFDGSEATNIESVYVEEGEKVFFNGIKFWSNSEGIVLGDPIENCMNILITRDGGNTWSKVACEVLPEAEKGEVGFAISNSIIATYGDHAWIATGGSTARVFHTPDKGKTWNSYDTPIISGEAMAGIHAITFWDENNGIVVGGNWRDKENNEATVAITTDGGKTWKLATDETPGYQSAVKYVPGSNGKKIIGLGPSGIAYSKDGGNRWEKLTDENFYALEFVNDTLAFAAGKNRISKLIFKK